MPGSGGSDFSQISARDNFPASGQVVTAYRSVNRNGALWWDNSAVLAGDSGGHSALIDIMWRPHVDMRWQRYDVVITATHPTTGRVAITAQGGYWLTRTLSAFSANGSAPSITTFFEI